MTPALKEVTAKSTAFSFELVDILTTQSPQEIIGWLNKKLLEVLDLTIKYEINCAKQSDANSVRTLITEHMSVIMDGYSRLEIKLSKEDKSE